jgi:DNA replication and repair protein RecF
LPFLSLSPVNFRNLVNQSIDLSSKEVFFVGENGQGKSNLLEALYYSSYGSSFRTRMDGELIKDGENALRLRSMYREENGTTHTTSITLENNKKRIEKDGKMLHDRKDLVNTMPCVLYNHDDLDFVIGSPERKRFFIDQSLSMYDLMYIDVSRRYKKVLKERNLSLKEKKYELLDVYDMQLVQYGMEMQNKRKLAIFKFNQIFPKLYEDITGIDGVHIVYSPSWNMKDSSLESANDVLNQVRSKIEVEKVMCTTMSGPHRDRIIFVRNRESFIPTASTGQRRLVALILRTAQAVFYNQATGKKPVLLMDDVLLELDPDKRQKVTALLPEYDQLFCTFLNGEPYERYKKSTTKIYKITNGQWTESQ